MNGTKSRRINKITIYGLLRGPEKNRPIRALHEDFFCASDGMSSTAPESPFGSIKENDRILQKASMSGTLFKGVRQSDSEGSHHVATANCGD